MDLIERLALSINTIENLPEPIIMSYLSNDVNFGIYAQSGSKVLSEDWSGLQEKAMPIQIAYKSSDGYEAEQTLYRVSNFLDELEHLKTDGTYSIEEIDIQPQPFLAGIGIDDKPMYLLDFTVIITVQTKNMENK